MPLSEAAAKGLPSAKATLAILMAKVKDGSEIKTAIMKHPFGDARAIVVRGDLGVEHWPTAVVAMLAHNAMMFKETGLPAFLSPPPLPMPEDLEEDDHSRFMLVHYPSSHSQETGYHKKKHGGSAPDFTLRCSEREVQTAVGRDDFAFGSMFHFIFDLMNCARATKVVDTYGHQRPFDFMRDFIEPLDDQGVEWRASMIRVLTAVITDEITERKRVGARALIMGFWPGVYWLPMLDEVRGRTVHSDTLHAHCTLPALPTALTIARTIALSTAFSSTALSATDLPSALP